MWLHGKCFICFNLLRLKLLLGLYRLLPQSCVYGALARPTKVNWLLRKKCAWKFYSFFSIEILTWDRLFPCFGIPNLTFYEFLEKSLPLLKFDSVSLGHLAVNVHLPKIHRLSKIFYKIYGKQTIFQKGNLTIKILRKYINKT